ncbi:lasso peptide biosynthesis B2 protein [Nocardiopsis salina]|uniref:lasso peptide biosynthesis B2 protein n=1 Tax=Nocardiopsis salina TaxID=245836 RepID=UPI0023A9D604|nr:lasso peptide biosynthesis B2 protein [Nocardiopsis salina]
MSPTAAHTWARTRSVPAVERVGWSPSLSTHEVPLEGEPSPRAGGRALITAALGVVLMVIAANVGARRKRMRRMLALLRWASALARDGASIPEATEAVNAVRRFGFLPWRMACLETSVATVIALALRGRSVTWHHGVRCDPLVLHAWVSVNGIPVAEPLSTLRCTTLLTIASKTDEEHP